MPSAEIPADALTEPLEGTSVTPSGEAPVGTPAPLPAEPLAEPLAETTDVASVGTPAPLPAAAPADTSTVPSAAPVADTPAEGPSVPSPQTPAVPSAVSPADAPVETPAALPIAPSADTSALPLAKTAAPLPAEPLAEPLAETTAVPSADTSALLPPASPLQEPTSTPSHQPPPVIPPRPEAPPPLMFGPQPPPSPPVRKDRRVLRAVLRWAAVVVVFAVGGAGSAYGITQMKRSDVPGLATASDGRWDYPEITRPPLPAGSPGPFAADNKASAHYADQRALLLPAPKGAKADASLRGTDGRLPTKTFLAQYADPDDRKELGQKLTDDGLRHIAARGWTTPDGTHTRIYLLQFDSAAVADELFSTDLISYDTPVYALDGALDTVYDGAVNEENLADNVSASAYTEEKPSGAEDVRQAYLKAGDTLALVVQSRKGAAKKVPFLQTVALQSQLLG